MSAPVELPVAAPHAAFGSLRALAGGAHPEVSVLGMALAAWSLVTMPLLGIAKQRIADRIGSAATKGEGRQNILCAYLAGALLVGLVGNAARLAVAERRVAAITGRSAGASARAGGRRRPPDGLQSAARPASATS